MSAGGYAARIWGAKAYWPCRKHAGQACSPDLFRGSQNAKLVIDQDVMFGRVAFLDIAEFLLFVDVDEHAILNRL